MSTSDGLGWGPLTPGPAAFAITAPPQAEITPQRQGLTSFTITNLTGRPVRARLLPQALQGADPTWISVAGPPELPMAVGATVTVNVAIAVPSTAAGGSYLLRLDAVPEDDTEAAVEGPSVAFVVPPPVAAKGRPKWLIPLLIGVLVLILAAGGAIYFFTRPDTRTASPAPSTPVRRVSGPKWGDWENLGGSINSAPAATSWAPGRLDVFAQGSGGLMYHRAHADGGTWSEFVPLTNGIIVDSPSAVSWGPDRIDAFVRGTDNGLWQMAWADNSWHGYFPFGGTLTATPTVASWASGRLDVFVRSGDHGLWQLTWDGSWHPWASLGGNLEGAPAAVSRTENTIDVFFRGSNNHLYQKAWDGTKWSGFQDLGGSLSSDPTVASWGADRLDVFAEGDDNNVLHKSWDSKSWSDWEVIGTGVDGSPGVVSQRPNTIDVFARSTNNELLHKTFS